MTYGDELTGYHSIIRRSVAIAVIAATTPTIAAGSLILACRQIVGIGDNPPTGNPGDAGPADVMATHEASPESGSACGIAYAGASCERCVESSCCDVAKACTLSPTCLALEACEAACSGDPTCRSQCTAEHGFGNDEEAAALAACLAKNCDVPCNTACGGAIDPVPPDAAAGCQSCIVGAASACTAMSACAADPGCQSIVRCIYANHTFDVEASCFANAGADAGTLFGTAYSAVQASCLLDCALGTDWACVGKFMWPPYTAPSTTVQVTLQDLVTSRGVNGATVKLCASADRSCNSPYAWGTTDPNGSVALAPEAGTGGWQAGYLDISSPSIVPEVAFWTAPFTTPSAIFPTVSAVTPDEVDAEAHFANVVLQPGTGIVFVQTFDCSLNQGIGEQLSISPEGGAEVFYLGGSVVSPTLDSTTTSGKAIFVNVPVDTQLVLQAEPKGLGEVSSKAGLFVHDGGFAYVLLPPTP